MASNISVGIDIGSHNTRVVVLESQRKKHGFRVIGTGSVKSEGIRHGYIIDRDEAVVGIKEALAQAQKTANTKIKRVLVSIGGLSLESTTGSGSHIISRIDGEVSNLDIKQVIQASEKNADLVNKRIIREFPLFFKLDNKMTLGDPVGMHGHKIETKVLFITSLDQHFDNLVSTIESSGVEVEDVVPSPFAASLVTLTKAQRTAGCVLANIGAETVSIVVFENDKPISLQVFPIGGADITNDIALGLRVSLEEAEMIKTGAETKKDYQQKKLDEMIEARLKDIFDLIEAHLKKINKNGLLPAGIIITGGGARLGAIEELAKASLKLPAHVTVPFSSGMNNVALDASWAVAYGLAILGFDDSYAQTQFLKQGWGKAPDIGGFLSWIKQFLP